MNLTYGNWHGVAIEREIEGDPESELLIDIMHPGICSWSIEHWPRQVDTSGRVLNESHFIQRHSCDVQYQLDEWGSEGMPTEPGFYWVRIEHHVSPSGPWGGAEYDSSHVWVRATCPGVQVEPGEPEPTDLDPEFEDVNDAIARADALYDWRTSA